MTKTQAQPRESVDLVEIVEWIAGQWARDRLGLPSQWDQDQWIGWARLNGHCGTTCCAAGRAALVAGYQPAIFQASPGTEMDYGEPVRGDNEFVHGAFVVRPGDNPLDRDKWLLVEHVARELLGLTPYEANRLFYGGNEIGDVLEAAKEILARRATAAEGDQA